MKKSLISLGLLVSSLSNSYGLKITINSHSIIGRNLTADITDLTPVDSSAIVQATIPFQLKSLEIDTTDIQPLSIAKFREIMQMKAATTEIQYSGPKLTSDKIYSVALIDENHEYLAKQRVTFTSDEKAQDIVFNLSIL